MKNILKPPFSYYGGKQKLLSTIHPLIAPHTLYCEPFVGGGAVFWSKAPSQVEVINDTNRTLINFYRVVKNDFVSLEKEIMISLHSRDIHRQASVIYNNPDMFSDLKCAWSVWVLAQQSFSAILDNSWGYEIKDNKTSKKIHNARERFTMDYAIRLQHVQIECADALYIIRSRDSENSFFYCDPPYYNSNCGHYDGYTIEDFEMLLKTLSAIKGKFMLSSYPSEILEKYTKEFGWYQKVIQQNISVNAKSGVRKPKQEVITTNY